MILHIGKDSELSRLGNIMTEEDIESANQLFSLYDIKHRYSEYTGGLDGDNGLLFLIKIVGEFTYFSLRGMGDKLKNANI